LAALAYQLKVSASQQEPRLSASVEDGAVQGGALGFEVLPSPHRERPQGMGPPEAGRRRQSGASRIDPPTAYGRGATDVGEEGFVLSLALLLAGPVGTGIKVLALPPVMRPTKVR